jgi:hypothetical protein
MHTERAAATALSVGHLFSLVDGISRHLPSPQGRLTRSIQRYGCEYVQSCHRVTQQYPQASIAKQGSQQVAISSLGSASTRTGSCMPRQTLDAVINFDSRAVEAQFPVPPSRRRGPIVADAPLLSSYQSHHAPRSAFALGRLSAHIARRGIRRPLSNKRRESSVLGRCAAAKSKAAFDPRRLPLASRGLP